MDDWKKLLLTRRDTILQAIQTIDRGAVGAAMVVDDNQHLIGMITDGDIRRGILSNIPLTNSVTKIMCEKPKSVPIGESKEAIMNLMNRLKLHQIPVVDEHDCVVGIEVLHDFVEPTENDNIVVVMAGGQGMRLRPLTENCPKPLLKVGNKPILELILEHFIEAGFHRFYFSINYHGDMIRDYFQDGAAWNVSINYLEEQFPLGTIGALSLLPEKLTAPVVVMNGDIVTRINFQHLLHFHHASHSQATLCVREYQQTMPYGVVEINNNKVLTFEEKPTKQHFVNAGIYVLQPEVVDLIPHDQEFNIPELIDTVIAREGEVATFPLREYWLDIGRKEDYERAHAEFEALIA